MEKKINMPHKIYVAASNGMQKKAKDYDFFLKETFHLRLKRIRVILPHVQTCKSVNYDDFNKRSFLMEQSVQISSNTFGGPPFLKKATLKLQKGAHLTLVG